jgi:hypothetical protein
MAFPFTHRTTNSITWSHTDPLVHWIRQSITRACLMKIIRSPNKLCVQLFMLFSCLRGVLNENVEADLLNPVHKLWGMNEECFNLLFSYMHWMIGPCEPNEVSSLLIKYRVFKKVLYNGIPNVTVWLELRKKLCLKEYKLCFVQDVERWIVCTPWSVKVS